MWGPGHCEEPGDLDSDTLFTPEELTVERFAKWIVLNDRLDGLAWAVARPLDGVLQVQVLLVTSLIEGLHRRLPYPQSRFQRKDKAALKRVREAAVDAAAAHAKAEGLDQELLRDLASKAISRLGDVSFRDRAAVVVTEVCGAVPARTEADRRLGDAVMAIHAAAQHVHARLHGIRAEVDTGIGALQSTMDTTTGQQQMAEFLAAKTRDVQVVIDEAREASTIHMAALGEARARYTTVRR